jgi:nitroimidazol reductase NimA-like FMN-containing flavoprotein (pyridoxamine 5'-phosphate oxidase superfamily)
MSNPNNAPQRSLADVRRKDRQVTDEQWIRSMLHECAIGTLATLDGEQPFLNMNLFAFDEDRHAIYMHTARQGRTHDNVEACPRVCFGISQMGRLLPAHTALEMSVEYASVMVFGRACLVNDPVEARHAMQLLLDKYFAHLHSGQDYRPITDEELARTQVYRIEIDEWSGKRKQVAGDFPGAFTYPGGTFCVSQ